MIIQLAGPLNGAEPQQQERQSRSERCKKFMLFYRVAEKALKFTLQNEKRMDNRIHTTFL